ncbi:MAG TPA: hypothetical protein VJA94_11390, partial [Candidatus Angelobacter sp.]
MNIKQTAGTLLIIVVLIIGTAGIAQRKGPDASEQTEFSAEDSAVKNPVPVPADVLNILRKDDLVRNILEDQKIPAEQMPASWFSASAIHLSSPKREDLVVVAEGPLAGGNVVTFWVFCATPRGYELVLMAPAHDLEVKNTRWKGHR